MTHPNDTRLGPNPSGLCACGCGKATSIAPRDNKKLGHVKGTPVRFYVGHASRIIHSLDVELTYTVDETTGCWNWAGTIDAGGYGQISLFGKKDYAHRFSFEQAYGPIAPGMHCHHRCRNRRCINPEHLEELASKPHRHEHSRMTQALADDVRHLSESMSAAEIAAAFGFSELHIKRILWGQLWTANPVRPEPRQVVPAELVAEIIERSRRQSQREIAKRLGLTRSQVRRALVAAGLARP